jgi:phosphopantetheine adenylyltransferase
MPEREAVTVELDVEVAAMLREHAAAEQVSEGEIVERALRAADLRALVRRIRARSDLDGDAAMRLVNEQLKAVRAERGPRAA